MWNRDCFLRTPQQKYNVVANRMRPGGVDYTQLMASSVGTFVSMNMLGIVNWLLETIVNHQWKQITAQVLKRVKNAINLL